MVLSCVLLLMDSLGEVAGFEDFSGLLEWKWGILVSPSMIFNNLGLLGILFVIETHESLV